LYRKWCTIGRGGYSVEYSSKYGLSLLPLAAKLGGCEDVINFDDLNLGQLKDLGSLLR
jgi:hypothetical protein